jgi:hypothetical protein
MNFFRQTSGSAGQCEGKRRLGNGKSWAVFIFLLMLAAVLSADTAPAQNGVSVTGIEVNQVLGVQKDDHHYFVAGKNTVIRAFLSEEAEIHQNTTYVQVSVDGKPAFKIYAQQKSGKVKTVDFLCRNMAACGNWAAGTYDFQPFINDVADDVFESYEFQTGMKIRVLAVAVRANYGTRGIVSVKGTKWKDMGEFMQRVYPLAQGNLVWDIREEALDASDEDYNLQKSKGDGTWNLSNALADLIPVKCKTNPQSKGCYDFVVGFINQSLKQDNGDSLAGYAYTGTRAVVAVASDDDAPGTVAHELAHQYGIGDTYDSAKLSSIRCSVNPAPDKFKGLDWDKGLKTVTSCTAGRKPCTLRDKDGDQVNGAQVAADDHPFEINGRGLLSEMADFMSEGGAWQKQMWITKDCYDWLYRRLVIQEPGLKAKSMVVGPSAVPQRFVFFSGTLSDADAVELSPWKSYVDSVTLTDTTGALAVRAVAGNGTILASTAFSVQFFMVHPPRTLTKAPFEGIVNFPAGTVKFEIVKEGTVLASVPVSSNSPAVTGVAPRSAATLSGVYGITWTGNDPDGNALVYTVEYNRDVTSASSGWQVLADELTAASWTQDFSKLPGGNHARIRVIAYDGVLFGEAESAEFVVPFRKPDVKINELPWGTVYSSGDDVLLTADVYDPQDGALPEDRIRWTSDIAGELGYGAELIAENLPAGVHTITVTATNSAGLSASAVVSVTVGTGGGGGRCFIATAAFGSCLHPCVALLQEFRDACLLPSDAGRSFVRWYYRISPPLADWIARKAWARAGVRILLLPAVGFSMLALQIGFFWSLLLVVSLMLLAGAGVRTLFRTFRR